MGCHIRNPKNPFEVQCLFPNFTEEFSLYFHSSSGHQDLIADCIYKEQHKCYFREEGFNMTHDDANVLTIAVPDTIWKQTGRFICQKGGQLLNVSCPFPPQENFTLTNSTTSKDGLNTAENFTLNNSLTSQVSLSTAGDDYNPRVIIGAVIGVAVVSLLILFITIQLFKKYNLTKSCISPKKFTKDKEQTNDFQRQTSTESKGSGDSTTPFISKA